MAAEQSMVAIREQAKEVAAAYQAGDLWRLAEAIHTLKTQTEKGDG